MRAAVYARVSTKDQAEDGFSIDAQLRAMKAYCAREGWEVVGEYVDEGVNASKESALLRPEFRRVLDDIEQRKIDVLVVHKLDRFSRNLSVTVQTLAKLDAWGAGFVSLSEHIDAKTPMGRLMLKFMASLAEWYSDNLSTEVAKRSARVRRTGTAQRRHSLRLHGRSEFQVAASAS